MKKFISLVVMTLIIGVITPITGLAASFKDVSSNYRFYEEILYLSGEDIISGFQGGSFKPDQVVTRAQAAIMIGRALDLDGKARNTKFSDVSSSVTGSGYIASAVEKGIISGFPDKTYKPGDPVTRGQMAIFLDRAFTLKEGKSNAFKDVTTGMKAYQAILNVSANGITSGYTDDTYRPDVPVTRGQFSAFMARTLEPSFRVPVDPAPPMDNSRSNPADIGETVLVKKDDWLDGYQKYEIELKQVISGGEAWRIVEEGNLFNDPPQAGMEYVLAKFRVKVLELENEPYSINHAKFDAISKNGVKYNNFISVSGVNPDLRTDLYKGAEYEGWTYFMVNEGDEPLAVFNQGWDDEVWFDISE